MIKFTVPGQPKVQQRHRVAKWGGNYDPSAADKKVVAKYALESRLANGKAILTNDVSLQVTLYGLRSNSDLDNGIKLISDALNGVIWKDDAQVVEIHAFKIREKKNKRTEVVIEELRTITKGVE